MIAIAVLAILYTLFGFYLASMNLIYAYNQKTIGKVALVLGVPIVLVGLILDILVNITIMSILFVDIPHEFRLTSRLKSYIKEGSGWRSKLATWICASFLNQFNLVDDNHCD